MSSVVAQPSVTFLSIHSGDQRKPTFRYMIDNDRYLITVCWGACLKLNAAAWGGLRNELIARPQFTILLSCYRAYHCTSIFPPV